MIQAVIIDDEVSNIENLTILLNKYCPKIAVAGTATNVDEGLLVIREINPSILFLFIKAILVTFWFNYKSYFYYIILL